MSAVNILNCEVDCIDKWGILRLVREWAADEKPRAISYVNAYSFNVACANPEYRSLLNEVDLLYADGIGAVWASRILGGCRLEKITGRDWIDDFCQMACQTGLRIYVLAGRPGVAQKSSQNLQKKYPGLKVVGASDGYFIEKPEAQVLDEIAQSRPQVLFVGMGIVRQEAWIREHRAQIPSPVCWAVGALFDYVAQYEPPVPELMNRLALEWLWRLIMDPLGKWQRYLLGIPLFMLRIMKQKASRGS